MRATRRIVILVLLVQVAWLAPLAIVLWIALDVVFLYGFGSAALVVLAVLLSFLLVWQRADARREALLATGDRVPALLVSSRPTGVRINNRVVRAHTFEHRGTGGVVRAEARAFAHVPVGTEATIAYDRADPAKAVVVEDLDRAEADGQLDWQTLRRQQMDRTFRDQ
jgi:hypothetical protein